MKKLSKSFYQQPVIGLAKNLLGKIIVHRGRAGMITEVEVYRGEEDGACHARFGKTARNAVMYGPPGYTYIYLCYGLHHLLNIVAEGKDFPAAVLIRGMVAVAFSNIVRAKTRLAGRSREPWLLHRSVANTPFESKNKSLGPGSLTKYLKLTKNDSGRCLFHDRELYLTQGISINPRQIKKAPRIGVAYAGKWADKKWRYYVDV